LRDIRRQKRFDPVPILILSAKTDPDTIREGLSRGANAYLTKPYVANVLIDRVRSLLEKKPRHSPYQQLPGISPGNARSGGL